MGRIVTKILDFHSRFTVYSMTSRCCRTQRSTVHIHDLKWQKFGLALHQKYPNRHLPEARTGSYLNDKIILIITPRASASYIIKCFNTLTELFTNIVKSQKILFPTKYLPTCSAQGFCCQAIHSFHTSRRAGLAFWIKSSHQNLETGYYVPLRF